LTYINFGSRLLKLNSGGTDVGILQWLLDSLPVYIAPSVTVDGDFGPKTKAAVEDFQNYFGLVVDGIVGKNTFLFLGQRTGPYLPSGASLFGARTLKNGSYGSDVWVLQNRLASTKKTYAMTLGGPADKIFGSKTKAAVKLFQNDHGLVVDGIVGPHTFYALFIHTYMGGRYLQRSRWQRDQGFDVYWLQVHLNQLGYYSATLDGKFGPVTQAAVKALQSAAGIMIDGVVGPQTYFHLAYS